MANGGKRLANTGDVGSYAFDMLAQAREDGDEDAIAEALHVIQIQLGIDPMDMPEMAKGGYRKDYKSMREGGYRKTTKGKPQRQCRGGGAATKGLRFRGVR